MYISQEIAERIKSRAKQRNISIGEMLSACELGVNTISKMSKGTDILTKNFAKIADYLDCSVDYLLGRTDNPEINKSNNIETYISKTNEPALPPRRIAAAGAAGTKQITPPPPRRVT